MYFGVLATRSARTQERAAGCAFDTHTAFPARQQQPQQSCEAEIRWPVTSLVLTAD